MTLKQLLAESVARRANAIALRFKEHGQWRDMTYHQLQVHAWRVAETLRGFGVGPGDRVAIFRENAPDWPECYFGIVGLGAVAVPMDAKLKEKEVAHILHDSGARVLFAGVKDYPLLRSLEERVPTLRHAVLVEGRQVLPPREETRIRYHDYDDAMLAAADAMGDGHGAYAAHDPVEDDMASLIYTSGTMGRQKGAMLTHGNFTANVASCRQAAAMHPSDNFLLVLPLHHALAFTGNLLCPLAVGGQISFVENLKTMGENIAEVSPTVLIGVPLLLEKMYARIEAALRANKVGHALFRLGIRKPIVQRVRARLGGRLRMVITGGAASAPEVLLGFQHLGIMVLEGYGLTETAPVLTLNPPLAPRAGTVGKPLPGVALRILEPDAEGVGEVAAKGANVMKGYYRAPEATAAVFRDGWFLTGDLGYIDNDGYLTITGRKKSLIVNREGKNIYPEEVQAAVTQSPFILEALALGYGDARDTAGERVGVIVVPDPEAIQRHVDETGTTLSDEEIRQLIRDEVKRTSAVLSEYKRPRRIRIRSEEFQKTSTGKVKQYLYSLDEVDVD